MPGLNYLPWNQANPGSIAPQTMPLLGSFSGAPVNPAASPVAAPSVNPFGDPTVMALLGLSQGLLAAGGPQRMPMGVGGALAQGIGGAVSGASQGLQNQAFTDQMNATQQKRGALSDFAKTLPPDQQAAFLASPDLFLKERFAGYNLRPGESRFVNGQPVATQAPTPTLVQVPVPGQPGVTQPTWLAPGQAQGQAVGGPAMPEILNPAVQAARSAVAASGKPDINVKVNTELGKGLAGEVKDIVGGTRAAASGAADTVETVSRMRDALESGKVNIGPGATLKNTADQVALSLGVGGKDTAERLVNTRTLIRGLAQSTIAARAQLKGQGAVSDFEGKLLERANSGQIDDFTLPELTAFMDVTERIARKSHSEHDRMLGVMRNSKDEAVRGLVPYFEVPPIPSGKAPAAPNVIRYDASGKRIQ